MKRHELHYLSSDKKTNIHALIWEPDGTSKGIIQLSHGITEYMERYEVIAQRITAAGWIFCGNDNLGHGESLIDRNTACAVKTGIF